MKLRSTSSVTSRDRGKFCLERSGAISQDHNTACLQKYSLSFITSGLGYVWRSGSYGNLLLSLSLSLYSHLIEGNWIETPRLRLLTFIDGIRIPTGYSRAGVGSSKWEDWVPGNGSTRTFNLEPR